MEQISSIAAWNEYMRTFVTELCETFEECPDLFAMKETMEAMIEDKEDSVLEMFILEVEPYTAELTEMNEKFFLDSDIELMQKLGISKYWTDDLEQETKEAIWQYLQTLLVMGKTIQSVPPEMLRALEKYASKVTAEMGNETDMSQIDMSTLGMGAFQHIQNSNPDLMSTLFSQQSGGNAPPTMEQMLSGIPPHMLAGLSQQMSSGMFDQQQPPLQQRQQQPPPQQRQPPLQQQIQPRLQQQRQPPPQQQQQTLQQQQAFFNALMNQQQQQQQRQYGVGQGPIPYPQTGFPPQFHQQQNLNFSSSPVPPQPLQQNRMPPGTIWGQPQPPLHGNHPIFTTPMPQQQSRMPFMQQPSQPQRMAPQQPPQQQPQQMRK